MLVHGNSALLSAYHNLVGGCDEDEQSVVATEDLPCIERSDLQCLCREPLVSVALTTYNHERHIRQAVESVMMQRTNFEFELIIGEDASRDLTREICFELQSKYPERIRVLWSEANLFAIDGNSRRVNAHCRGRYIAFLEGDDYWIDPLKLQKQVDLLQQTDSVGCVAWRKDLLQDGRFLFPDKEAKAFVASADLFSHYYHTSTYLFDRRTLMAVKQKYAGIKVWHDTQVVQCMCCEGRLCLLPEVVSVYRHTGEGMATSRIDSKQRLILSMQQLIPMYLYGPEKLRRDHGLMALMMLAHSACSKEIGYTEESFRSVRKEMYGLFWSLQCKLFPDRRALGWIPRLLKYRVQAMLARAK